MMKNLYQKYIAKKEKNLKDLNRHSPKKIHEDKHECSNHFSSKQHKPKLQGKTIYSTLPVMTS